MKRPDLLRRSMWSFVSSHKVFFLRSLNFSLDYSLISCRDTWTRISSGEQRRAPVLVSTLVLSQTSVSVWLSGGSRGSTDSTWQLLLYTKIECIPAAKTCQSWIRFSFSTLPLTLNLEVSTWRYLEWSSSVMYFLHWAYFVATELTSIHRHFKLATGRWILAMKWRG